MTPHKQYGDFWEGNTYAYMFGDKLIAAVEVKDNSIFCLYATDYSITKDLWISGKNYGYYEHDDKLFGRNKARIPISIRRLTKKEESVYRL